MKISIIIPNYNGEELIKINLPKVFEAGNYHAQKYKNIVEVIIVDDASTDGSEAFIKSQIPNTQSQSLILMLIKNDKNLGFSKTVNKGVKVASGEIVVLLNTDVAPEKDFIGPLIVHFSDSKMFAVGCMDKSIEGAKTVLRGRGLGKWERGFLIHRRGEVDKTSTLWVAGGSGAFRKSIWDRLGGLIDLYSPFYWEDIDISYRAQKSGYKVLFEPKSIVIHEHQKGAIKVKYSPFAIKTISYRNQIIFSWVNISDFSLLSSHLFWLPYQIIKSIIQLDAPYMIGLIKAFLLLPRILLVRNKVQSFFIKTDKLVITEVSE